MKYLHYFSTSAEYQTAYDSSYSFPWISYCEETQHCEYSMKYLSSYIHDSNSADTNNGRILSLYYYLKGVKDRNNLVMIFYNDVYKGTYTPNATYYHSGSQTSDSYDYGASVSGTGSYNGYSLGIHEYEDYNGNSTYSQQHNSFSLGTKFYEIKQVPKK